MTAERKAALRSLIAAATPGPWISISDHPTEPGDVVVDCDEGTSVAQVFTGTEKRLAHADRGPHDVPQQLANAALIAESRTALPEALDEIDRLQFIVETPATDREWRMRELLASARETAERHIAETARLRDRVADLERLGHNMCHGLEGELPGHATTRAWRAAVKP